MSDTPRKPKAVLVISSHVVRGSVGNRAVAFALEALGHPVWTLPTITLAWHPGQGPATRIIPDDEQFATLCNDIANAPWKSELAGVITGYMANVTQVDIVKKLINTIKTGNENLIYLCDPVLGDFKNSAPQVQYGCEGRLYVEENTADAIRENLLPIANIITPNLFELSWLVDKKTAINQTDLLNQARKLAELQNMENVLVTSVPGLMRSTIANVLINPDLTAIMGEHKSISEPPNGLGDLTSALFLSHRLNRLSTQKSLEKTTSSVFEVLARTAHAGADELALESNITSLSRPQAMVNMRHLK